MQNSLKSLFEVKLKELDLVFEQCIKKVKGDDLLEILMQNKETIDFFPKRVIEILENIFAINKNNVIEKGNSIKDHLLSLIGESSVQLDKGHYNDYNPKSSSSSSNQNNINEIPTSRISSKESTSHEFEILMSKYKGLQINNHQISQKMKDYKSQIQKLTQNILYEKSNYEEIITRLRDEIKHLCQNRNTNFKNIDDDEIRISKLIYEREKEWNKKYDFMEKSFLEEIKKLKEDLKFKSQEIEMISDYTSNAQKKLKSAIINFIQFGETNANEFDSKFLQEIKEFFIEKWKDKIESEVKRKAFESKNIYDDYITSMKLEFEENIKHKDSKFERLKFKLKNENNLEIDKIKEKYENNLKILELEKYGMKERIDDLQNEIKTIYEENQKLKENIDEKYSIKINSIYKNLEFQEKENSKLLKKLMKLECQNVN